MVMILSEPTIWSPAVRTVFGHASRIQIVERNRNSLYLELCDNRPEDKIKMKSTILDRDVYEKKAKRIYFTEIKCSILMVVPVFIRFMRIHLG